MNKLFLFRIRLMCVLLSATILLSANYCIAQPIVSIGSTSGCVGDTVTVPINVANFTNIGAITLEINFNQSGLRYVGFSNSALNLSVNNITTGGVPQGRVRVVWYALVPSNIGQGLLMNLRFAIQSPPPHAISFNLAFPCELADVNGDVIAGTVFNSGIITGVIPQISTQPPPITSISSSTASISVSAINTSSFQWQRWINNQWINLSNNGQFQGVSSSVLQINQIDQSLNNSQFRVRLEGPCGFPVYSTSTQLIFVFLIPSQQACLGDTASIAIKNPILTGVANAALRIIYNPDSLTYVGYTNLNTNFTGMSFTGGNGAVVMNWNASTNHNIPSGNLVTLRFRVNGSSLLTWDTIVFPSEFSDLNFNPIPQTFVNGSVTQNTPRLTLDRTICSGQSFSLGSQTYTTSGSYQGIRPGSGGACDTLITLNLTVLPSVTTLPPVTRCSNQPYLFNGMSLSTSGVYRDTLVNSLGCDSFLVLNLSVNPSYIHDRSVVICPGSSYSFGSQTLTTSGSYTHTFTTQQGCDSLVNLTLSVANSVTISSSTGVNVFCPGSGVRLGLPNPIPGSQYQWMLNGSPIPGETLDTLHANQVGTYQLRVVVSSTCSLLSNEIILSVLNCNRVRGDLRYDNNAQTPMAGVPVHLKTIMGNILMSDTTDSLGLYEMVGYPNGNYLMDASVNYSFGGVNSTDALWVSRYFTSVFSLPPLRIKAGDVNASGVTNSSDALNISRRVTNVILSFPAGEFVNSQPSIVAQGNPVDVNLRVLSTGDVNGSYGVVVSAPNLVLDTVYSSFPTGTAIVRFTTSGSGIYERGVCWGASPNPTISVNKSIAGTGGFDFTHSFGGLTGGTQYYVRAYARNSAGTYYSNERSLLYLGLPSVVTFSSSNISSSGATSGGNVTSNGGFSVTARGVAYGTSQSPTTANSTTSDGTGTGAFTSTLTGLTASTLYYVRAYATNAVGTAYGSQVSFTTTCGTSTVSDVDNNTYTIVQIGTQCWTQSNLKVSKYRNGDNISNITDNTAWSQTNTTSTGAWCNYNNDAANDALYGKLYNWYAVNDSRGLCPTGWHVPTDAEWNVLVKYLDPNADTVCGNCWSSNIAGGMMKSIATQPTPGGWIAPNTGATNLSGFTGLPGGGRGSGGGFGNVDYVGLWWSSSVAGPGDAWSRGLTGYDAGAGRDNYVGHSYGMSIRCLRNNPSGGGSASLPTVTTTSVTGITSTGATTGGNVTADGGASVTARGVAYGTAQNLTTVNSITSDGTGTGAFTSTLTGLTSSTVYYVRAYATNSVGTAYGNELTFSTQTSNGYASCGSVSDIDGNTYQTVQIGTQCWTQSNLKVSKYRNGDNISNITDQTAWSQTNSSSTGAWCNYSNSSANDALYGKLYNWYAVNDSRGLCPTGWHVPSDAEWTTLTDFLGGLSVAGGKMKSTATQPTPGGWNAPNTGATNSSGFTGLPGGRRVFVGGFDNLGYGETWWSSSVDGSGNPWIRLLEYDGADAYRYNSNTRNGFSVRCVRD